MCSSRRQLARQMPGLRHLTNTEHDNVRAGGLFGEMSARQHPIVRCEVGAPTSHQTEISAQLLLHLVMFCVYHTSCVDNSTGHSSPRAVHPSDANAPLRLATSDSPPPPPPPPPSGTPPPFAEVPPPPPLPPNWRLSRTVAIAAATAEIPGP